MSVNKEYTDLFEKKVFDFLSFAFDTQLSPITTYDELDASSISALYSFKIKKWRCSLSFCFGIIDDLENVRDITSIMFDCKLALKVSVDELKKPISDKYNLEGRSYTALNESITNAMKSFEDLVRLEIYNAKKNGISIENDNDVEMDEGNSGDKLDVVISLLTDIKKLLQTM